jgi:2'-5' RNA ligase
MTPTQTALIVAVPEAEDAVGPFRATFDTAASWGVPAHVTVLYPFLPPEQINAHVLTAISAAVAEVPRFDATFTHVEWFDDAVVWLAPQPNEPFRQLTDAVWRRFPETPPYAGAHPDSVPHLTIGHDQPKHQLSQAAEAVSTHLPIRAAITAVRLITGAPEPQLDAACQAADQLAQAAIEAFAQHPDAQIITSFPGLSELTGTRVLAELGDDRTRFADARALKAYAGSAPITRASGKSSSVHHRRVKNQRLAAVGYVWAFASLTSPGIRAHYDRRRHHGDRHTAALRNTFNRLLGCLHHCLQTRQTYDETTAFPTRSQAAA